MFATNVKAPISLSSTSKPKLDEIQLKDTVKSKEWSTQQNSNTSKCICCGENHSIHRCKKLTEMSAEEKKKCIHENKLCFACLRKGHNAKDSTRHTKHHAFVDQEVCEKLQAAMEPVKLKLSTMMGKDSIVSKSQRVCDLKVRGLSSNISINLPLAYMRDFIPLDRTHIPTCQTVNKWKHLVNIAQEIPPLMDCGVGLLIGYDCSRVLIPRKVITGGDYEPNAIKTDLGWSIVGSELQHVNAKEVTGLCHRVSVRELPPITPSSVIKAFEFDFADTKSGDKSISQEDICFLQILKGGIQQNRHGHLEMPLSFKVCPHLPENKKLALTRLKHLKRKLDRDPKFKYDHVRFMEGVFKDEDAEKVDNQPEPGKSGISHIKGFTTPGNQTRFGWFSTAPQSTNAPH